jgi:transposase
MKVSLYVRNLNESERTTLEAGLRSQDGFRLRRCQILLASARQEKPQQIAKQIGCTAQTVRNVIHDFTARGLACLVEGSHRPVRVEPVLTAAKREQLQTILHQSPRSYGKAQSQWTLKLLAEVCQEQGLSEAQLSAPTLLDAVKRLGSSWRRAKHWIVSPDPRYELKKSSVTASSD